MLFVGPTIIIHDSFWLFVRKGYTGRDVRADRIYQFFPYAFLRLLDIQNTLHVILLHFITVLVLGCIIIFINVFRNALQRIFSYLSAYICLFQCIVASKLFVLQLISLTRIIDGDILFLPM